MLAACALSCAKTVSDSSLDDTVKVLESFIHMHYPQVEGQKVGNGIYILEDEEGWGGQVDSGCYIFINYKVNDLFEGTTLAHNSATVAMNRNEYDPLAYYGPTRMKYYSSSSPGMHEVIDGGGEYGRMRIGGKRKAIVPSWIYGASQWYTSEQKYKEAYMESSNSVLYSLEIVDTVQNITKWQIDTTEAYMISKGMTPLPDTTYCKGFYLHRNELREKMRGVTAEMDTKFPSDTTIYIEYIGRLLNGRVFDTNITDTAIRYGIKPKGTVLSPVSVAFDSDSLSLKMSGSSLISGFSYGIWKMHPYESADLIFISKWGYGDTGSGTTIPAFSPLLFEINIVDKP